MFKQLRISVPLILVILIGIFALVPAIAQAGGNGETCTTGNCQFMPATFVPGTSYVEVTQSHNSSDTNISVTKVKRSIRKYERRHHVTVAVRMKADGVTSMQGCSDPTKKSWGFHAGDVFTNTRSNGGPFSDRWVAGLKICDWHLVRDSQGRWWAVGTKSNCGNTNIRIPVHFKLPTRHIRKVIDVPSYAVFYTKYVLHKQVSNRSDSSSYRTITTAGGYTCPSGWELVGDTCKSCPSPRCVPPSRPRAYLLVNNLQLLQEATITTDPNHPTTNVICVNVYAPAGDSLTIVFNARYGTFRHEVFYNVQYGPYGFCDTYVSPTEIPPGGVDPTYVTVVDNTTTLTATSETVNQPIVGEGGYH